MSSFSSTGTSAAACAKQRFCSVENPIDWISLRSLRLCVCFLKEIHLTQRRKEVPKEFKRVKQFQSHVMASRRVYPGGDKPRRSPGYAIIFNWSLFLSLDPVIHGCFQHVERHGAAGEHHVVKF